MRPMRLILRGESEDFEHCICRMRIWDQRQAFERDLSMYLMECSVHEWLNGMSRSQYESHETFRHRSLCIASLTSWFVLT